VIKESSPQSLSEKMRIASILFWMDWKKEELVIKKLRITELKILNENKRRLRL